MSCLIEIDHLTFCYHDGRKALDDVCLHIQHGQRVGLVGPNGAGKTTLFHVLSGVTGEFQGEVNVSGCDLQTNEGRKHVHKKLGIVFQQTDDQIFNTSVEEDIAFGPLNLGLSMEEVQARVEESMQAVGLADSFRERVPYHLSSGEKRRVAIAGVLAMKPALVLLDEPSSDLDPRGRRELVNILNGLTVTRVVSSHHLEFILETCERAVLMDQGHVKADGPATEILANEELMQKHGLEVPHSLKQFVS